MSDKPKFQFVGTVGKPEDLFIIGDRIRITVERLETE